MIRAGQHRRGCRGILMADALVALGMASVLLLATGIMIAQQSKAERKLAEVRREMRTLETSLLEMQATGKSAADVEVERLRDTAPAGQAWVRVSRKNQGGQVRSLVGLVPVAPAGAAPGGATPHE